MVRTVMALIGVWYGGSLLVGIRVGSPEGVSEGRTVCDLWFVVEERRGIREGGKEGEEDEEGQGEE